MLLRIIRYIKNIFNKEIKDEHEDIFLKDYICREEILGGLKMTYYYNCLNELCENFEKEIKIEKPMSEVSKKEFCEKCKKEMNRIFKVGGIKTGDGYKS